MARLIISCLVCWLLLLANTAAAQQYNNDTVYSTTDTTVVDEEMYYGEEEDNEELTPVTLPPPHEVVFSKEDLTPVRKQKDFAYMAYIDSVLRHQKFEPVEKKVASKESNISLNWLKPVLWTIAILALLFLLYQIWTNNTGIFSPGDKKLSAEVEEEAEDPLMLQGAATLAQQAIASKQYRMATRYLFIDALSRLDERGLIQRIARKTNQQYLNEIQQPELKETLATAMLQFEYVWYGEFNPNEKQFERIHHTFKQLEARWL